MQGAASLGFVLDDQFHIFAFRIHDREGVLREDQGLEGGVGLAVALDDRRQVALDKPDTVHAADLAVEDLFSSAVLVRFDPCLVIDTQVLRHVRMHNGNVIVAFVLLHLRGFLQLGGRLGQHAPGNIAVIGRQGCLQARFAGGLVCRFYGARALVGGFSEQDVRSAAQGVPDQLLIGQCVAFAQLLLRAQHDRVYAVLLAQVGNGHIVAVLADRYRDRHDAHLLAGRDNGFLQLVDPAQGLPAGPFNAGALMRRKRLFHAQLTVDHLIPGVVQHVGLKERLVQRTKVIASGCKACHITGIGVGVTCKRVDHSTGLRKQLQVAKQFNHFRLLSLSQSSPPCPDEP